MFATLKKRKKNPFRVTWVYHVQIINHILLQKMSKIGRSVSGMEQFVRDEALHCVAACSHFIMCKPKGTDDAGLQCAVCRNSTEVDV